MFGSMFGFGRGNSKDSHGGLSGSFGSHRGSTSSRRREELRRNLPRPSPEFVEWFRRPEFAATVGITFAFALAFALLTAWSRGVPRAFVGQIAIDSRINLAQYETENQSLTNSKREEARRTAPRFYVANGKYLSSLKAKIEGLPVATFEKRSVSEIDNELANAFDLSDSALAELQRYGGAKVASENWRTWTDRLIGSLWSEEPIVASQEYQLFMTTLERYVLPPSSERGAEKPTDAHESPASSRPDPLAEPGKEAHRDLPAVAIESPGTRVDTAHELPPGIGPIQEDLRRAIIRLARDAGFSEQLAPIVAGVVVNDPRATIGFDENRTKLAAEQAADAVPPEKEVHLRGEVIYADGDRITPDQLSRLIESDTKADAAATWRQTLAASLGSAALGLALAVLILLYTVRHEPAVGTRPQRLAGVFTLMFLTAVFACLASAEFPLIAVPACSAACLLAALIICLAYGQRFAFFVSAVEAILLTVATDLPPTTALVLVLGCGTLVACLREVRHRATIVRAAGITAIVSGLGMVGLGVLETELAEGGLWQSLRDGTFGAIGSYAVGFLVLGMLPSIEKAFGISTGLTLAELRDPRHPLLRQMQERAAGTYNHSLQVASLAEAAAEAIGADGLLAYAGALYHDIGKVNKPEYFVENQLGSTNKHERLSPAMSLLVIVGHVKDGLELAKEYGLPKPLHHFIESHHGTTLVEYFFHRAKTEAERKGEDEDSVEEFDFRYPGPRPRTKEAAILMLCDCSESATRALNEPTHNRIEGLVRSLARRRLDDGQFDECPLTFAELKIVEDTIIKTLSAIHHGRIAYPSTTRIEPKTEIRSDAARA
jgi:putative nucleotidyltransferase with HDIG domain